MSRIDGGQEWKKENWYAVVVQDFCLKKKEKTSVWGREIDLGYFLTVEFRRYFDELRMIWVLDNIKI